MGRKLSKLFDVSSMAVSWLKSMTSILPEFRKVPEAFRKPFRKLTEACLCFTRNPEGSGRFQEACQEACFEFSFSRNPEASGSFQEGFQEAYRIKFFYELSFQVA